MYVTPLLPLWVAYLVNHSTYEAQVLQRACPDTGAAFAKNRTEISAMVQKLWGLEGLYMHHDPHTKAPMCTTPVGPQRSAYIMNHSRYAPQILQGASPNIGAAFAKSRTEISAVVEKFWGLEGLYM